jgi:hypothetical protein
MNLDELDEILNSLKWIKVKAFDPKGTLQEKYDRLMDHHIEETDFLIKKVRELAKRLKHADE